MKAWDSIISKLADKSKKIFIKKEQICDKSYHRGFRSGFATLLESFPPKGQEWIALEEKYPPYSQFVVIKRDKLKDNKDECFVSFAWYDDQQQLFYQASPKSTATKITHWMPLITENLYVSDYETEGE